MKSFLHFLGQVNKEKCYLLQGDECHVDPEVSGSRISEMELVLWHLTPDMALLADKTAFRRRVAEVVGILPESGRLALYWENPFSVHAFCGGFRGKEMTADVPDEGKARLSYANMRSLFDGLAGYATSAPPNEQAGARETVGAIGDEQIRWFYPYPSLSFVTHIFSDARLPQPGECEDNDDNFDAARLEGFDEERVTDALAKGGLYPQLAHAYLVVVSGKAAATLPDYARFSVQRREACRIVTKLYQDHVEKAAFDGKAAEHVLAMEDRKVALSALVDGMTVCGKTVRMNEMILADRQAGSVSFAFAQGRSLEVMLDELLRQGRRQAVCDTLLDFCRMIRDRADRPFVITEEFQTVFGDSLCQREGWEERFSLPVTDIDLVCQNILISDQQATVIDYEWTFAFPVPVDFFLYRFLYLYLEAKNRNPFDREETSLLYEKAGISREERVLFEQMETHFQQFVQAGGYVLRNAFEKEGKPVLRAGEIDRLLAAMDGKYLCVRYPVDSADDELQAEMLHGSQPKSPAGTKTETETYVLYGSSHEGGIRRFAVPVKGRRMELELSGFSTEHAMLRIGALKRIAGESMPCMCETNGVLLGGLVYLFAQTPVLTVSDLTGQEESLLLEIEEINCSQAAAQELRKNVQDLTFLVENREQQLTQMRESASWKLTRPLRKLRGE